MCQQLGGEGASAEWGDLFKAILTKKEGRFVQVFLKKEGERGPFEFHAFFHAMITNEL